MYSIPTEKPVLSMAKTYCLVMAIPSGIGLIWFYNTYSSIYISMALFVLFSQVIISVEPQKFCKKKSSLTAIVFCGFIACVLLVYQIYNDFTIASGSDKGPFVYRSLLIISLIVISTDLLKKSPK